MHNCGLAVLQQLHHSLMSTKRLLHGPCNKPPPGTQGHFFDIYVNSAQFPLPSPVPEMANIDPLDFQKAKRAKQAQARQEQLQGAASAANRSPKGHSMAREESMAAESGIRQLSPVAQAAAASTDAETVYPNKKVTATLPHFCWTAMPAHAECYIATWQWDQA